MLRYSVHARKRMRQRQVLDRDVERVCNDPEATYPDGKGNQSYVRAIDGRSIRVVREGADLDFIITVIVQGE
jgi:hypothetical protein